VTALLARCLSEVEPESKPLIPFACDQCAFIHLPFLQPNLFSHSTANGYIPGDAAVNAIFDLPIRFHDLKDVDLVTAF